MSVVMDMLEEILDDSPKIRPNSPRIRPDYFEAISEFSPDSPHSPDHGLESDKKPAWCAGPSCHDYEENNLWRNGMTPGCILRESDMETWRRLDRLTTCPLEN